MTPLRRLAALALLALAASTAGLEAAPARRKEAYGPPPPPSPYDLCDAAVTAAWTAPIPATLLPAIARVESGRLDPVSNRVRPWPWTINVDGVGTWFETKEAAVETVAALQALGVRSIDVGCMQVNLYHHATAFPDLQTAFDPTANARYAARFLLALNAEAKDWSLATAWYHSQTQERGEDYQRRVFGRVVTPMGPPRIAGLMGPFVPPMTLFGAMPPASLAYGAFAPAPDAPQAFASRSFGGQSFGFAPAPPPAAKPARR